MEKLTGYDAIEHARKVNARIPCPGMRLSKYADPTEDARSGLTVEEAEEVAREDPSLIYCFATVKHYQIYSTAGEDYGIWQGATPAEALAAMHREAGYSCQVQDEQIVFDDDCNLSSPGPTGYREDLCGQVEDWDISEL